jgi:hypothetical protein
MSINRDWMARIQFQGNDNHGVPKVDYLEKVAKMSDEDLSSECYWMIYHSARCNDVPRADWHWMVDACGYECDSRGKRSLYSEAYDRCVQDYCYA